MIRVAIIDDDRLVGAAVARLFDGTDVTLTSVSASLEEGIELILRDRPDIVVCDVMFQGQPVGLELPTRLAETPAAGTPVLMLSSYDQDHLLRLARQMDAAGYLTKGTTVDVFLAGIRVVHAGGKLFPADDPEMPSPSPREVDVVRCLAEGLDSEEVAQALVISKRTVEAHISRVYARYAITSRSHLIAVAASQGWITRIPVRGNGP